MLRPAANKGSAMIDWRKARATLEAYAAALGAGNKDAWVGLFTEDATLRDPAAAPPVVGRAAIADFWDKAHSFGMTLTPQVSRIVVCGEEAMLVFQVAAQGPDGSGVLLDVCDVFALTDDGHIRSMKAYWDKGCLRQIAPTQAA
jgi:steroid delta-isomerase